jgi:hypothetical protein
MADSILGKVIEYLASEDESLRDVALAWLCEGYMNEPQIAQTVFTQWDNRTPESAFLYFPGLSYFPVNSSQVAEACDRAHAMAIAGSELTSLTTRCAGKLLEQTVRLPASDLRGHLEAIRETVQSSKIFFRVDMKELEQRIALLDKPADDLANLLNQSVTTLAEQPDNSDMVRQGLRALEALRQQHPAYMDLAGAVEQGFSSPANEASLRLLLSSLSHFPSSEPLEASLKPLLLDSRESILAGAIEALVHRGSGLAAQALVDQFQLANDQNRRWIARGLQRMRVQNLATLISELREPISDHALWMMLLVAEVQQLDPSSGPRIVESLQDIESVSQALIDAGMLYTFVCSPLQEEIEPQELEASFRDLLLRVHSKVSTTTIAEQRSMRTIRRNQNRQIDKLYNKRRKS